MRAATAPVPVDPMLSDSGAASELERVDGAERPGTDERRQAKRKRHYYLNQARVALSYTLDGLFLMLYALVGTVAWQPAVLYTVAGVSLCGFWAGLRRLGWTDRLRDPEVTRMWWFSNVCVQLVAMWLMPELNFMFVLLLFIVYISLTLRSSVQRAAMSCVVMSVGIGAVLTFSGEGLNVPDGQPVEQVLAVSFLALTLWRCLLMGAFNSNMTASLRQRSAELAELTRKAEHLAHHDELTGLLNRRSMLALVEQERQNSLRKHHPLSIAMVDLDHFKSINDRLGHHAGDETLKTFARHARSVMRKSDALGRHGGEEFLLLLVDTRSRGAELAIERIRDALHAAGWSHIDPELNVTFSCGIATLRSDESVDALIKRADDALYRAKHEGRNRTCLAP